MHSKYGLPTKITPIIFVLRYGYGEILLEMDRAFCDHLQYEKITPIIFKPNNFY